MKKKQAKKRNKKSCKNSSPCFQTNFKKIIRDERDLAEIRKEYI